MTVPDPAPPAGRGAGGSGSAPLAPTLALTVLLLVGFFFTIAPVIRAALPAVDLPPFPPQHRTPRRCSSSLPLSSFYPPHYESRRELPTESLPARVPMSSRSRSRS